MKLLAAAITLTLATMATPAHADEPTWDQVKRLEIAYQGLNAIDAAQTCDFLARGVAYEINPLLGRNPSCAKVVGVKFAGGIAHYLLIRELYKLDPKIARFAAIGSIVFQGGVVAANLRFTF